MYNAPALKKALEIIRLIVRENKPLGVTEIARILALSKSTTFGILKSLEGEGLVLKVESNKKYIAGGELFELSRRVLRSADLTSIARSFLERLVEQVDETVFLGVREDDIVKVLEVVEPRKELKISSPVGARFSLFAGVIGKIFLAPLRNEEILSVLAAHKLPQFTENSITDPGAFLEEIEKTRLSGYAVDFEEYLTGMRAVATLIYSGRLPVGAIWIVGFTSSLNDGKLPHVITHLKQTAEEISQQLSPFFSEKNKQ
jgi:IclR family transcriptional regulator, KDG regulon repressor